MDDTTIPQDGLDDNSLEANIEQQDAIFSSRLDLQPIQSAIQNIESAIRSVIVGQQEMIDLLMVCLLAKGHALIEGVPGTAKTLTAKLLAKTVDTDFSRIQFTPDLMPSDVLGTSVFNFKSSDFDFKKGPIFSNIILIDEINRAPAKTQAALFEVMEERQITMDGVRYKMTEPFMVLATQNPIEQEGTYRLPEAQLDRFLMKIEVGYPTEKDELQILRGFHGDSAYDKQNLENVQAVVNASDLEQFRKLVNQVQVEEKLLLYITQIVGQTRNNKDLYLGASTRASLALLATSKSYALMQGRDFVTPEDIQKMAIPVMRHRIILSPEREMEGLSADYVIERLLQRVEVPR